MDIQHEIKVTHPIFSLFQVGLLIHHLNKKSDQKFGLTLIQWMILKHLIHKPASSAHMLAKVIGIHPSSITPSLKRLVRKQLVFVDRNPRDSRKKMISITRNGKKLLDQLDPRLSKDFEEVGRFSNELETLRLYLETRLQ